MAYYFSTTTATTTTTQIVYSNWVGNTTVPIWDNWCQATGLATTGITYTPTIDVWYTWVDGMGQTITERQTAYDGAAYAGVAYVAPIPLTPEQIATQEAERAASVARQVESERLASLALVRSRSLLESMLTPYQRHELERHQRFHVTGSRGRRYCIRAEGQAGNVDLVDDQQRKMASLCAHPGYTEDRTRYPNPDAWLTQMLHIETDEDGFLAVANVSAGKLPPAVEEARTRRRMAELVPA